MKRVIFACVHNAGRSQMAAAFFNQLADVNVARAESAGTHPADCVHPEVVVVMREVGVDRTRSGADVLITMGCGDECPVVPGVQRDDWPLNDPKGRTLDDVRRIRDDIRRRVVALLNRV